MIDVVALSRTLRFLWAAICGGAALLLGVLGWMGATQPPPLPEAAEGAFYVAALVSVAATVGAFALLRTMEGRLLRAGTDAEAAALVRSFGVAALAAAELPALVGAVVAFLTGDLLALAFGATVFAFAALTWPSPDRVRGWLALGAR